MEIKFEAKNVQAFRECFRQIKRTQVYAESIVPDVCDDVGRLFSVQPRVLLKSKDLTARGVSVTGEVSVALLYVSETENRVFDLTVTQGFSLDYDVPETPTDLQTQIRLSVGSSEARVLNPRKISVTVEICGELSGYAGEERNVAFLPPAPGCPRIYAKEERGECMLINGVCEKTFVLNEQFLFPVSLPVPERLIAEQLSFRVSDCQLVGSKALLKGLVGIKVLYASQDCAWPQTAAFSAPFSQLVETGTERMDAFAVRIEPNSTYYTLTEGMSGEKTLDAEIHALVQIVSRFRQEIGVVSDAYCNQMPYRLNFESMTLKSESGAERLFFDASERVELPVDRAELLSSLPTLGAFRTEQGRAEGSCVLDLLYRNAGGTLSAIRRTVPLSAELPSENASLLEARLEDCTVRVEGKELAAQIRVELSCVLRGEEELRSVVSVTLDEEAASDPTLIPSVTAVRADGESLWELARNYHSSIDVISAVNDVESPLCGRVLLIPKER